MVHGARRQAFLRQKRVLKPQYGSQTYVCIPPSSAPHPHQSEAAKPQSSGSLKNVAPRSSARSIRSQGAMVLGAFGDVGVSGISKERM
ncbi:hypothetical protein PBY51_006003 [Eleginops maclovinus]|uniref:Uncharacterized protein n=1 Tax=Eleginops maclovinus TaxID=56733 RepID=A0AAN8AA39_ELEMC|nr:hypothetical protein PBY51_006003 [Eleginops maclovinus]